MNAGFIEPDNPKWSELLTRIPHDVYHLPGYVKCAARHEGGRAMAFYAEQDDWAFLVPLLIRDLPVGLNAPSDWRDATTPYGYPAPVMTDAGDLELFDNALRLFRQLGGEQGIITAFFRLHPLLPAPLDALSKYGALVNHGQTVLIDLASSPEEIGKQMRYDQRISVRKLTRSGFKVKMDDWSYYQEFIDIYHMTMKRLEASEYYLFSDSYFADLRSSLGHNLHLCVVLSPTREVAAAGLFTTTDGIVQYHLSGTSLEYLHQSPTKLLLAFVSHWAKEEGNRLFHLGGGLGGRSDSLFQFKAGFSKLRANFFTYRIVLDTDRHATLDRLWREHCGNKGEDTSDFFPSYRRPCN